MSIEFNPIQLIEDGFSLEIGKHPDTPLNTGDQLLMMDMAGHVLIARAPVIPRND